jgi:hypothetical protein
LVDRMNFVAGLKVGYVIPGSSRTFIWLLLCAQSALRSA